MKQNSLIHALFAKMGKNTCHSLVLYKAVFLFLLYLFGNAPDAKAQPFCDDKEMFVYSNPVTSPDCYREDLSVYFSQINHTDLNFQARELIVELTITGDGFFDGNSYELVGYAQTPVGTEPDFFFSADKKTFTFQLTCLDGNDNLFTVDYGDQNNPLFKLSLIVEEGEIVQVTPTVHEGRNSAGCQNSSNCEFDAYGASVGKPPVSACSSMITAFLDGMPTGNVDPHEEVPLVLKLYNHDPQNSVILNGASFQLTVHDIHGTLPKPVFAPYVPGTDPPPFEGGADPVYTFVIESLVIPKATPLPSGAYDPGCVSILAASILPPEGLANLYGEAGITVDYITLDIGGTCCSVDASSSGGSIVFPGIFECDPAFNNSVNFSIDQVTMLDPCEVGFEVSINTANPIDVTHLLFDIGVPTSGDLMLDRIIPGPSGIWCGGIPFDCPGTPFNSNCMQCTTDQVILEYNALPNDWRTVQQGVLFTVVLSGLNGCMEGITLNQAAIQPLNSAAPCIPQVSIDPNLENTICNGCNLCADVFIELSDYQVYEQLPGTLNPCEAGFSVYLNAATASSDTYTQIDVGLVYQASGNPTITVTPNPDLCPPQSTTNCVTVTGNTIEFTWTYDPSQPVQTVDPHLRVIDVVISGVNDECVTDAMFTNFTEVTIQSGISMTTCNPRELSPNDPVAEGTVCVSCIPVNISGNIAKENGDEVYVQASADSGIKISSATYSENVPTDGGGSDCESGNGDYSNDLCNTSGEDYSIVPNKDDDDLNGVTTYDLVLIQKHILNVELLDSPYKLIAADANRSNTVTTFDLVQIRQLILYVITKFPSNTSWRFVPKSYTFPNPSNPWQDIFPEVINLNNVTTDITNQDFVAIKVGDVNLSADCGGGMNFQGGAGANDRQAPVSVLLNTPADIKVSNVFEVELTAVSQTPLTAWQMGLHFDPAYLLLEEVEEADIEGVDSRYFGLTEKENGKVRALWYSPTAEVLDFDGTSRFAKLRFRALRPFNNLRDLMHIDQEVLQTVAYSENGTPYSMQLSFSSDSESSGFEYNQPIIAYPAQNPFKHRLALMVEVPLEMALRVKVLDMSGKQVTKWEGVARKGVNEVAFREAGKWQDGLYTWQVVSKSGVVTGQVVKQ